RKCSRLSPGTYVPGSPLIRYRSSHPTLEDFTMTPRWLFGLICLLFASPALAADADLILHNGKVVTVDKKFTVHQAIAVQGGKVLKVGSNAEVLKTKGAGTEVIDLG